MPLTLVPEVDRVLRTATEWQFNAFKLAESTNHAPLSTLCFWLLQTQGLIREFGELHSALATTTLCRVQGRDSTAWHVLCSSHGCSPPTKTLQPAQACGLVLRHSMHALNAHQRVVTHSVPCADLDARRLTRFLLAIEAGYSTQQEVLYHSRSHAADVLQSIFVLMRRGALDKYLGTGQSKQLAVLAAYLAAAVHDYQHVGLSNDFLIRTCVHHWPSWRCTPAASACWLLL